MVERRPLTPNEEGLVRLLQKQVQATVRLIEAVQLAGLRPDGHPLVEASILDAMGEARDASAEAVAFAEMIHQGKMPPGA